MLNVIYEGETASHLDKQEKEQYLDNKIARYSRFCLLENEKRFIKDLLLLIALYMECVLLEEEYNTITVARLLNCCKPDVDNEPLFFVMVKDAILNEEGYLSQTQIDELRVLLNKVQSNYNHDNILVALQVIQLDSNLNPECSCLTANLLNLAILRCNSQEDELIDVLCNKLCDDKYLPFVFPELSSRSEVLFNNLNNQVNTTDAELLNYVYDKYLKLPHAVKEKLKEYDFQVRFTRELFGKHRSWRKLGNTRICGEHIRVWMEGRRAVIDLSFNHEMGHVVDYLFGDGSFFSKTDEAWSDTYEKEKGVYYNKKVKQTPQMKEFFDYTISNKTEYFASVFADYVEAPQWLKETTPNTYYYIETVLGRL